MTNSIKISTVLLLAFFFLNKFHAQDFQGQAIYKSHQKMNVMFDSTEVSPERQTALNEMLARQLNKEYVMDFDKEQSSYKEQ